MFQNESIKEHIYIRFSWFLKENNSKLWILKHRNQLKYYDILQSWISICLRNIEYNFTFTRLSFREINFNFYMRVYCIFFNSIFINRIKYLIIANSYLKTNAIIKFVILKFLFNIKYVRYKERAFHHFSIKPFKCRN